MRFFTKENIRELLKSDFELGSNMMGMGFEEENSGNHFADKGPSSQGYGFSSGHVWM